MERNYDTICYTKEERGMIIKANNPLFYISIEDVIDKIKSGLINHVFEDVKSINSIFFFKDKKIIKIYDFDKKEYRDVSSFDKELF